jgi:RNA polymerase sigma-70 factor (ECF subfamily)
MSSLTGSVTGPVRTGDSFSPFPTAGTPQSPLSNASAAWVDADEQSDFGLLLAHARAGMNEQLGQLLQLYRNYLTILATTQIDRKLRRRVSPSDVVQEAMLAAHRDFLQYRGRTEREFLAWLRQILIHTLQGMIDTHIVAKKRTVRCEVSLDWMVERFERSAANLVSALVDPGPSPSAGTRGREAVVALANQLAKLPPQYRDALVLRNLQGLTFEEMAPRLDKSTGAVRMLWLRAMERFKQCYESGEIRIG